MWVAVFAKEFCLKLRGFTASRRDDIRKAIERVLVDPTLNAYRRPYLAAYRQEHPTDKTLTVFFAIPYNTDRVFFVWINDDQHPHDTRKKFGDDPCLKEFVRLEKNGELEVYSKDFHEGKFTVVPRANTPKFMKFEKYDASVHANVIHDGSTHYAMAIVSVDQPGDLFDHYKLFISHTREHFLGQHEPFEFRVVSGDTTFLDLLRDNIEWAHWNETAANGETIFSIRP